jgi:hypothetical protein
LHPGIGPVANRTIRLINASAASVTLVFISAVFMLYTAVWNRGTLGLIMQVFGIGQMPAHWGSSKNPMHSVHFTGSIWKIKSFS